MSTGSLTSGLTIDLISVFRDVEGPLRFGLLGLVPTALDNPCVTVAV